MSFTVYAILESFTGKQTAASSLKRRFLSFTGKKSDLSRSKMRVSRRLSMNNRRTVGATTYNLNSKLFSQKLKNDYMGTPDIWRRLEPITSGIQHKLVSTEPILKQCLSRLTFLLAVLILLGLVLFVIALLLLILPLHFRLLLHPVLLLPHLFFLLFLPFFFPFMPRILSSQDDLQSSWTSLMYIFFHPFVLFTFSGILKHPLICLCISLERLRFSIPTSKETLRKTNFTDKIEL